MLEMLSEGIAAQRGRYGAYLHRDRVNGKLRARRGARSRSHHQRRRDSRQRVCSRWSPSPKAASLERWTKISRSRACAGDVMLLGNTSWRIRRIEGKSGRVIVEDAHGAPTVPFWRGEAPARTAGTVHSMLATCGKEISDRLPVRVFPWDFRAISPSGAAVDLAERKNADSMIPARSS
jgi:ATP-dependent Lhr-like helicase